MKTGSNQNSPISCWLTSFLLVFPVLSLILFHWVNLLHLPPEYRWSASFLSLPGTFFSNLFEFRLNLPAEFGIWMVRTVVGILPCFVLGWGILERRLANRLFQAAASIPIGISLYALILEWIAMAGWFTQTTLWVLWLVALGLGLRFFQIQNRRKNQFSDLDRAGVIACGAPLRVFGWSFFLVLTWLNFQHALFYPPNYWDALIYYLYYPKLIFQSGGIPFPVDQTGFPELVQGQVGLGLGANYPHLFLYWQASVCTLFGEWSSFPGQFMSPIAGLGTALVIYFTARQHWKSERVAIWCLLLIQSVPYWIWYQHWVSDYPLAVWLTATAIGVGVYSPQALVPLVILGIGGSHLNYLMLSLWWFAVVAWWTKKETRWTWKPLLILFFGILASSTWLIRNQVVTGNPVYAFFAEVFGGINIDLNVLKSCQVEWSANGDGLGSLGNTLWERLLGTPYYLLLDPTTHLKAATLPLGWFLPGIFVYLFWKKLNPAKVMILGYILILLMYEYVISGLYLYHILPIVPLAVWVSSEWLTKIDNSKPFLRRLHTFLVLLVALTVGFPAGLLGAKLTHDITLSHTLSPGMDPDRFLLSSLGTDYELWQLMNARLPQNAVVLTHENRNYYLRDDIRLIHLDDYRLVPFYGKPGNEVLQRLRELGVTHYLKIPNEGNHPILRELGIDALLPGRTQILFEKSGRKLYFFTFSKADP